MIPKGDSLWQSLWELHLFLCSRSPLRGSQHYQHGLHWGHQGGLHAEGSLQPWHLLSLLLVLQDSLYHILEVAWCFECLVSIWIQSIQPLTNQGQEQNISISGLLLMAYEANAHFCFYLTTKGGTYTCFAPAFIFRSCLISLMMHFRSLPVHLKWERRFRDSRHLSALLSSSKKETGQGLHKKRSFPSVGFKLKGVSILLETQRHKSTQKDF